ncbi:MAG: hypothetical protein KJZ73_00380 [Pseudorhodoplanes sp.]|nr:hypothetical protein [Pseudorhodoplanes sp.]GIK79708.1 MAG: hypothetical protein BroJett024_08130 [Alphaproteobacteria bacterium]
MRSSAKPAIAVVTAAAIALTSFSAVPALAAPRVAKDVQAAPATETTDFSSRRYLRHRGNAAAAAAIAAIIGGIATYAAAREYRKARERELQYRYGGYGYPHYYYYYGPRRYYRY